MTQTETQIEREAEAEQPAIPTWIWGVTAFVACYAIMQLQKVA